MLHIFSSFFFFNDTATTEIYTLSLHDALPISKGRQVAHCERAQAWRCLVREVDRRDGKALPRAHRGLQQGPSEGASRSEEHTSELQSPCNLVCRLLLEKKKKKINETALLQR